jgi:CRP/FNR family transcriptional regulator, nitrogen fixation regulation protein
MLVATPAPSRPFPSALAAFATSPGETILLRGLGGLPAKEASFDRDEEIYGESEPAEYLYRVRNGAVRTFKLLRDGRRQIDAFHLPGEYFGLTPGQTHILTAEAVADSRVAIVKRRALENVAERDAETACALWRMVGDELRNAQEHMLLLGRKSAMERVVAFLLDMDRRLAVAGVLALPMCRRDIGDYLGLTLETVSRSLSALADRGVLSFSGSRQIVLKDRQRLRAMTE